MIVVDLMVAVEIVEALEDAAEPSNPHPVDIHHTSVAKVVNIWSNPTSIRQLLKRADLTLLRQSLLAVFLYLKVICGLMVSPDEYGQQGRNSFPTEMVSW